MSCGGRPAQGCRFQRARQHVSGGPGVTILRAGVEVFARTAYITADEAELHDQGPVVHVRGNVKISVVGNPRQD